MCATDTPLGIALRNIRIHSASFECIKWFSILNKIPGNSYPSQHTIQDVFSHWLQQGDSWQFLSKSTYHTRCIFPLASAGRFLTILIQVNLPYKMYFPIVFSREIPDNSYPSQLTIHDAFSHWLQQGDSRQFLSKSGYHTRCFSHCLQQEDS